MTFSVKHHLKTDSKKIKAQKKQRKYQRINFLLSSIILYLFFITFTAQFIVSGFIWHVSSDHDEFFHTPKVRGITYRKRRTPQTLTKSFTSFPINYWHAVVSWKASQTFRWSVWWIFQLTNRLPDTLHQINVWLERGRSSWPQSCTYACMHMYIQLQCCCCCCNYSVLNVLLTVYLHWFPLGLCVCHLLFCKFWLQPTGNT